ncbi:hypothetical protein BD408DRAFT_446396, partial [Parasitella parasitica]
MLYGLKLRNRNTTLRLAGFGFLPAIVLDFPGFVVCLSPLPYLGRLQTSDFNQAGILITLRSPGPWLAGL